MRFRLLAYLRRRPRRVDGWQAPRLAQAVVRRRAAYRPVAVAALVVAGLSACGDDGGGGGTAPTVAPGGPVPVVVDTDLAADDLVALLFLLTSDEADVRAVTISGTGEVRCPKGLEVAARLLAVTGDDDIPVACGRSEPLDGDAEFPEEWRDATDEAYGLPLPDAEAAGAEDGAVDLLVEHLDDGVTLLTLGPLTNVAEALRSEPDLAEEVRSIVVMGGALRTEGNVFGEGLSRSTAEWNVYVDPVAADEVLASGAPVVLVPLDATGQAPVTPEFVDRLEANADTEPARLVAQLLGENPMVPAGEYYFWDPLAAVAALGLDVVSSERETVTVVTEEGVDQGRTEPDEDGHPVTVVSDVDAGAFEELLIRTLAGLADDDPLADPPPPVGQGTISFDGTTCNFDGPTSVPPGTILFEYRSPLEDSGAAVVHLTGELTLEQVIERAIADPPTDDLPAGIDAIAYVEPSGPTRVDAAPPAVAIACSLEGGIPVAGPTITVG